MKENKIRAEMSLSHAEAAERTRRNDESGGSAKGSSAENKQFLAKCLQKEKSERLKMELSQELH